MRNGEAWRQTTRIDRLMRSVTLFSSRNPFFENRFEVRVSWVLGIREATQDFTPHGSKSSF